MLNRASAQGKKRTDSRTKTGVSKNGKGGPKRSRRNGAIAATTVAAAVAMSVNPSIQSASAAPSAAVAVAVSVKEPLPPWKDLVKDRPHQSMVLEYLKNVHKLELNPVGVQKQYEKLLQEQAAQTALV